MKRQLKLSLSILLILALSLMLVACGGGGGKDKDAGSNKLVVYSPNSEGLMSATIPLFEEETGIKVEVQQAGTGELLAKLRGESSDPVADVMYGGSYSQFVQNAELFQEYTSPNEKNVGDLYKNKTGYTTSYVLDGSCLIVNKSLIGDIEIKGYKDLLNPELKGKIATADPANSSSAFAQLTNILKAMGGYESQEAWDYVKALFQNIDGKIQSSSSNVYKMVADGEMVVGLTYEDPVMTLVRDGGDVEIIYPEEGAVYLPATIGIVKDAKNLENAKKFVDFLISEKAQNKLGTDTTNRPVMPTAQTSDFMKPITEITVIEEDMDYVNQHKEEIVKKFKDIFAEISSQ